MAKVIRQGKEIEWEGIWKVYEKNENSVIIYLFFPRLISA